MRNFSQSLDIGCDGYLRQGIWNQSVFLKTYFCRLKMLEAGKITTLYCLFGSSESHIGRYDCICCFAHIVSETVHWARLRCSECLSFYTLVFFNSYLEIIYRYPSKVSKANMTILDFFSFKAQNCDGQWIQIMKHFPNHFLLIYLTIKRFINCMLYSKQWLEKCTIK